MTPSRWFGFGSDIRAGSPDLVFDVFMLIGPVLIVLISVLGRTPWTVSLATGYVGGLVVYVGYKGFSTHRKE